MFKDTTDYNFPQGRYPEDVSIYWENGERPDWMTKVENCHLLRVAIDSIECNFSIDVILYAIALKRKVEISVKSSFYCRLEYAAMFFYSKIKSSHEFSSLEILKSRKFEIVFDEIKRYDCVDIFVSDWNQKEIPNGYIYAIKSVGINRIKIGYSENPKKRLQQLSTGSSVPLELWGIIPANFMEEKKLHSLFSEYRITGEWFELDGPVVDWATSIKGRF